MRFQILAILFLIIFLSCSDTSGPNNESDWYLQYENQDDITYYAIHFANENIGWIAGYDGTIKKSVDGGDSWTFQQSGVTSNLWDICFIDEQTGWICGSNNTILKTENGGESWNILLSVGDSNRIFVTVQFSDENNGWMSSNQGEILKSTDGGNSWEVVKNDNLGGARISIINENTIYILSGKLYHSNDGGNTWESDSIAVPKNYAISNFYFIDENRGYITLINGTGGTIITDYPILSTIDGGNNWELSDYYSDAGLNCVYFIDQNNGWVGGIENVYRTKDGGNSWSLDFTPENDYLFSKDICFVDKNHGWIINYDGQIFKYKN